MKVWLAENPRVTMHFTPTSRSWLNMVEIFFGIITKQAIRRGSFHSLDGLEATISAYIASYNTRATPFIWTKAAEYLIGKINRKRIINTGQLVRRIGHDQPAPLPVSRPNRRTRIQRRARQRYGADVA